MGVPKFFRYISERYPCLSELVREYQIPEFDNMYLDMNGIIHMCSHPDDNNPHFRITEERIFQDIFHYIEVLFRMIRPQKLFFMAIDGVAPRAKMNQQRGRRFRSAKDAERQETEAKKKGETLPTEARFDSNCITPGTVFMARLHEQLKYFCIDKISSDPLWRNVKIILSGHETPGEGEHKIMDYIRYIRAQSGYDPNTRHCLYGLDADLIMLGLCTHEPHFSLLREEVKFGKKSTKRQSVPEEITFFLLHLSLMREYLELEFAPIKNSLVGFEYDFEKIIDDWVLMGFLVGNDFIPHLPHLHIANGALPILYKAYMEVLPTLDGYINEGGTLNLARFEKFMEKLASFDMEMFEEVRDDFTYMESKTGRKVTAHTKVSTGQYFQEWVSDNEGTGVEYECLESSENEKSAKDCDLAPLLRSADKFDVDSDEEDDDEEDKAFKSYKKEYYMNKLEYANVTPEVLRYQAEGYVRAIQWNLNYYYNGVCSWSWYYPHHYAPYISDIKGFADLKIGFDLGTPFKPYEQLLAVLPAASKSLLPEVYHWLMTSEDSAIRKYYPDDFQTDKNGKRQEWEAVVLIPFMDEKLLLEAMRPCNEKLTPEEVRRNTRGPMLAYTYTDEDFGQYEAPGYFPAVKHNHCKTEPITIESIRVPKDKLVKGAYPGVATGVYYPGFPTLKHLKYTAELKKAKVKVFEQPSRYESMIISIVEDEENNDPEDMPVELLGSCIFVGWPHLVEGRVISMSNKKTRYFSVGHSNQYNSEEITDRNLFKDSSAGIIERYRDRLGIDVGEVKVLCHVQMMIGRKYVFTPNGMMTLEKQFSEMTANYPLQTVLSDIEAYDSHHTLHRNVPDVFPEGVICFALCHPCYGAQGIVVDSQDTHKTGRVRVCVCVTDEPNFDSVKVLKEELLRSYKTLFNAASQLGMSHFLYSRITSSIYVETPDGEGGFKNVNVGLDLKFNKRNKETPGYTRKIATTWYFTDKCTDLVREYSDKFPEIFVYLAEHGGNDSIRAESVFGEDWDEKILELSSWLRTVPTYSMERQPCGSQVTETEIVLEIEKLVDEFPKIANSKKVTMTIKPAFLYKPELQTGTLAPDPKMQVQLLDRVVNTRRGFSVPFGLKGTVIAITESASKSERDTMYDVVFDKPFKDGMQLNCSPGRGYRLSRTAFIDISYGKRVYEQKTGKEGSLVAMASSGQKPDENPRQNTYGQKFFNQFINSGKTHRQIPDQYSYYPQKASREDPLQGSAFAPFTTNNKPRDVLPIQTPPEMNVVQDRSQPKSERNEAKKEKDEKKRLRVSSDIFVPAFNQDVEKDKQVERSLPKEVLKEKNPVEISNSPRPVVDTNFLRNLLKIGNDVTAQIKSPASQDVKITATKTSQKVQVEERSSNVSFEMLAQQVGKTPASVRLLTYYQSNGLGIPRYQYFQTDGKFKSQITLTNGDLVLSESADSKEQATENVASKVLALLMRKVIPSDTKSAEANGSLPVPPQTWVEPTRDRSVDRDDDQALKAALHNPFVPTQVIKRQVSKTNTANSRDGTDTEEKDVRPSSRPESKGGQNRSTDENKEVSSATNLATQKKKPKKSRIAANFAMKM